MLWTERWNAPIPDWWTKTSLVGIKVGQVPLVALVAQVELVALVALGHQKK
jgi:hypothetical protein